MTVPGALGPSSRLARRFGDDVLIGAGTVLDAGDGARLHAAPARSSSSAHRWTCAPSSSAAATRVPIMPGALTPTEVLTAWKAGADVVKVFPCGALGGASYIKSLKAPLPQMEMIPTGGVSVKTAADFIKAGAMALGVGADLADTKAIRDGNARLVTDRAREYVRLVQEARAGGV